MKPKNSPVQWAPSADSPELKGPGSKSGHALHQELGFRMCDSVLKFFISGVRKSIRTGAKREI